MHKDTRIAVVGGGIGGLAVALGLARAGFRPRVYEQASKLGEVGAGISLSPNAMKGLRFLGLYDAISAIADEPPVQVTRHFETGELLVSVDRSNSREQFGAPYLQMHRADLHGLMHQALVAIDPDAVVLNKQFSELNRRDDATYLLTFVDGSNAEADLVIGADGLKSTLRGTVFAQSPPEFSGFVAWRGLLPTAELNGHVFPEGGTVFVAPGRLFVRYPIRHGKIQNFVAFSKVDDWASEGWSQTGDFNDLRELFADFDSEVQVLLDAYREPECHKWGLFARQPLPRWVSDGVTVLGDAAHPMLPWFGQGAATSIEDGVILSRAINEFDDLDVALARYEAARRERVTKVHNESLLGGERLVAQDPYELKRQPVRTEDTLGLTLYDPGSESL